MIVSWVFSTALAAADSKGHTVFDSSKAKNYKQTSGSTWSITYGDGSSSSGTVGTAPVTVGGVVVSDQSIELASKVSTQFVQDTANDGLLGLAFASINTVKPKPVLPFFDNAISTLAAPLFTATLKHDTAGSYTFGSLDSSKYTGDITYVDVDSSQGFWAFTPAGYKVGTKSFSYTTQGIADTGTTLLLLGDAVVKNYYAQVSSAKLDSTQGGYVFPCTTKVPAFEVELTSGVFATIPAEFMNYAPVDSAGTSCFGALQSSADIGIDIYGDIFLKSQYVIFENKDDSPRLGFAAQA
jgi:Eukaryotic aspartyl protease